MGIVKDIMRLDSTDKYVLRAKQAGPDTQRPAGFVGWVETRYLHFFACNRNVLTKSQTCSTEVLAEHILRSLKIM